MPGKKELLLKLIEDENNTVVHLDIDPEMKPDIVCDVLKNKWWTKVEGKYDIIFDTISHIGPQLEHKHPAPKLLENMDRIT